MGRCQELGCEGNGEMLIKYTSFGSKMTKLQDLKHNPDVYHG